MRVFQRKNEKRKEERPIWGCFLHLGTNSVVHPDYLMKYLLKYGRLKHLSMDSYPHWLRIVPSAITPLTSGVCSHDVVKGSQRETERHVIYT